MKLYYSPFACSLASHIIAKEADVDLQMHRADLMTKELEGSGSLFNLNPSGQVPTLRLDNGNILTEGAAILQYLADLAPEKKLAPAHGSFERYRLIEWLNFISTELHKRIFYTIFSPSTPDEARELARAAAPDKLAHINKHLSHRDFLLGDNFTAADAYLLWWLLLSPRAGIELGEHEELEAYIDRCMARPNVQAAVAFEETQLAPT